MLFTFSLKPVRRRLRFHACLFRLNRPVASNFYLTIRLSAASRKRGRVVLLFYYKFTVVLLHKKKKSQVTRRKNCFIMLHQVTWRATCTDECRKNITCTIIRVTVFYQPKENGNIANQIHGFTIDFGKFILSIIRHNIKIKSHVIRLISPC